jgi:hypothetical protein
MGNAQTANAPGDRHWQFGQSIGHRQFGQLQNHWQFGQSQKQRAWGFLAQRQRQGGRIIVIAWVVVWQLF